MSFDSALLRSQMPVRWFCVVGVNAGNETVLVIDSNRVILLPNSVNQFRIFATFMALCRESLRELEHFLPCFVHKSCFPTIFFIH